MTTPICDFVRRYADSDALRLHMPGHKGKALLGIEKLDITEIDGADSLYEADGIIRESEANAGALFGAHTFYSTEGSSQCIRAMLCLATLHRKSDGKPLILAGRNAHKTFLSAAALLDLDVRWLTSNESYLSCCIDADRLEAAIADSDRVPTAVYITSPDYLGNTVDIAALSEVCRRHGTLLIVDNAHGAYLKFLPESRHPIDCGADLCCDSAHKTLPALTGAAYLHLSPSLPNEFVEDAKRALSLFGSTSPSYLILQSLDAVNRYLAEDYRERLAKTILRIANCSERLTAHGYTFCGDEPLKLTVNAKRFGYTGVRLAKRLREMSVECEFADPDFLVLMLTPENDEADIDRLEAALCSIEKRAPIIEDAPTFTLPECAMSIREATLHASETLPIEKCCGRILSTATVGCPPAVPIVVSGERIDDAAIRCFEYYHIEACTVIRQA